MQCSTPGMLPLVIGRSRDTAGRGVRDGRGACSGDVRPARSTHAFAQFQRYLAMTAKAQRAEIVEVAFAATFRHGQDMIRIPEGFARTCLQSPVRKQGGAACAARIAKLARRGHGVNTAPRAETTIALEHLFAKVGRLRTQLPLVNAV